MKNLSVTLLKICGYFMLTCFTGLVVWANWEKPSLSDELNLKPINLVVYTVKSDINTSDSIRIANTLKTTSGVSASTVNPGYKTVSITFYEDQVKESDLTRNLSKVIASFSKMNFDDMEGPKCPIPSSYIDTFLNIKHTLCFR